MSESKHTPVAQVAEVHMSRYTIEWTDGPLVEGTDLYGPDLAAEVARLREENDRLRAKLGNSPEPCAYCALPAAKLLECQHGFPGCPRADDMMLCGHFGAAMDAAGLRADLDDERRKVEELREALAALVHSTPKAMTGNAAFNEAWRRARAALAASEPQRRYYDCGECPRISTGCEGRCAKSAASEPRNGEQP